MYITLTGKRHKTEVVPILYFPILIRHCNKLSLGPLLSANIIKKITLNVNRNLGEIVLYILKRQFVTYKV